MIRELQSFIDFGIPVIEASSLQEWYYDPERKRLYFMAPHWFVSSAKKADQLGYGKFKDFNGVVRSLKGVHGMLAQSIIALTKFITMKLTFQSYKERIQIKEGARSPAYNLLKLQAALEGKIGEKISRKIFELVQSALIDKKKARPEDFYKTTTSLWEIFSKVQMARGEWE